MEGYNIKRKTIKLADVRQNNIVWTDLGRDLSESIFEDHFKRAIQIIQGIIDESDQQTRVEQMPCRECKRSICNACRYQMPGMYNNAMHPPVNRTSCHTAVPFIGERGTGKTSVMFSVLEYLNRYRGEGMGSLPAFKRNGSQQDLRFITFDMIDAAMLTSAEDVMEIILSRMLSYLEDLSADLDFRDLYRQIDELHKNLGRRKHSIQDGYGLASLQQMADSQKVIGDFSRLVNDFRKAVGTYKFGSCPCFLVIALDDVDLYQGENGGMVRPQFAFLEYIYNHMRIPGLVVLLTFNEYILRRICNRHFADIYFGHNKPSESLYTHEERRDIENLTAQFMSKLFPQEQRIYLPDYSFVGTDNKAHLYIDPLLGDGKDNETVLEPFAKGELLPAKAFMLRLIAHRTGIYFDGVGTKRHFFESRNLRELGEVFQIVNRMEDPGTAEDGQSPEDIRAKNSQKLLDYFYHQYALKHLTTDEYRYFQDLSMVPIGRQNVYLIDRIRLRTLNVEHHERWQYSYGELLRCIYSATRPEKNAADRSALFTKEFVHCILGTHSAIMKQMVRTNNREEIRNVIGSSITGKWANEMLPSVQVVKDGKGGEDAGSISKIPVCRYFDWKVQPEVVEAMLHLDQGTETVGEYLEALLLAGMFFTGFAQKQLQIQLMPEAEYEQAGDGKKDTFALYMRSASEDHVCFNILNFVINLYDAGEYLGSMRTKLTKLGVAFAERISADCTSERESIAAELESLNEKRADLASPFAKDVTLLDSQINELKHKLRVNALRKAQLEASGFDQAAFTEKWKQIVDGVIDHYVAEDAQWQNTYGGKHAAVLPVEHFDMMYNIIKRLANPSYYDRPEQMNVEEIYSYCVSLCHRIAKELKAQDEAYVLTAREDCFADAFRDCVFFRRYAAKGGNAYISRMQKDLMCSALGAGAARRNNVRFSGLDSEFYV